MWPFRKRSSYSLPPGAEHVAIIGNGITGVTAALRLRQKKPKARITIISGENPTFYSRPALMYIYMGHLKLADTVPYEEWFWAENGIDRVFGWVTEIDTDARTLRFEKREPLTYDKLLIATGSETNKFDWPGQDLARVHGLYGLGDLAALENISNTLKRGVIVGGGLIGIELAEMLLSRGIAVTMLVRETNYWNGILPDDEAIMVNRVIRDHRIDLRLSTELAEIVDDGHGRACAVLTKSGDRIECEFVGLTAGVRPNIKVVKSSKVKTDRGVLVDFSFHTNIDGVFAAGDCAELVTPGEDDNIVEQLWYTGKLQGHAVASALAGENVSYDRGVWFNSAKFLDVEYQTYGMVNSAKDGLAQGEKQLWWTDGDRRGLRIQLDDRGCVKGMNAMGLRHRHRIWERWIQEKRSIDHVLDHLSNAGFDPEFYSRFEREIVGHMKAASR